MLITPDCLPDAGARDTIERMFLARRLPFAGVLSLMFCLAVRPSDVFAARQEPPAPDVTASGQATATAQAEPAAAVPMVETHRFRIVNARDGAIQVSTDRGQSWQLLGRVLIPAVTVLEGYLASQYAPPGTIAATAVHGIRVRVGNSPNLSRPFVLTIEPKEYAVSAPDMSVSGAGRPNKGFGGYAGGAAGIFTDIPAGTSLFRGLAPFTGNPVFLEEGIRLVSLPSSFRPVGQGETLVVIVQAPQNSLTQVTFENKAGGTVEATYVDGKTESLTTVVQPVQGVGRFDGTAYTGVGRLNTAHTGVITVSTAPIDNNQREGEGRERRGGFQIEPAWHNSRTEEAGAPMVMTVGPPGPRRRALEGMPPLFRDAITLGDNGNALVDCQIDNGPWEPLPAIVGARPYVFTGPGLTTLFAEQGTARKCTQGITAFRLRLPARDKDASIAAAARATEAYKQIRLAAARAGKTPIVKGVLTVNANPTNADRVSFVRFSVEGLPRGFTNIAPFTLSWDTTRVPDGDYLLEAEALDDAGSVLATTRRRVFVLNHPATTAAAR